MDLLNEPDYSYPYAVLILTTIVLATVFSIVVYVVMLLLSEPHPRVKRHSEEQTFLDPSQNVKVRFPTPFDSASVYLSVIVPAYNEEDRLPKMLDECLEYLEQRNDISYEVIVVSDGSVDGTVDVANTYVKKYGVERVRVLKLIENRGKGGAVRLGMMSARGALLLFADADGATKFSDFEKLEKTLDINKDANLGDISSKRHIAIGSRSHLEQESIATRSIFRSILMHGFHFLVWLFCVKTVKDTQCGFKLFSRHTAKICFANMHVERWAFDVEVLFIAERLRFSISEVAVTWTEIDGSKVTPVISWIQMGVDLLVIWFKYQTELWQIRTEKQLC